MHSAQVTRINLATFPELSPPTHWNAWLSDATRDGFTGLFHGVPWDLLSMDGILSLILGLTRRRDFSLCISIIIRIGIAVIVPERCLTVSQDQGMVYMTVLCKLERTLEHRPIAGVGGVVDYSFM